jgi:hypothetical protein
MTDQNAKTLVRMPDGFERTQINTRAIAHKGDCGLAAQIVAHLSKPANIGWVASIPVGEIAAKIAAMGEDIHTDIALAEDDAAADIAADASAYLTAYFED